SLSLRLYCLIAFSGSLRLASSPDGTEQARPSKRLGYLPVNSASCSVNCFTTVNGSSPSGGLIQLLPKTVISTPASSCCSNKPSRSKIDFGDFGWNQLLGVK